MKVLARLCKVSGWIAIQKQLELQEVPASGSLISVDELTWDELATLGIAKDVLGNGRWFEVVYIVPFDPRESQQCIEVHCLHRSDADVDARRKREAAAEGPPASHSPNYERLAAFFRDFGRSI